MPYSTECSLVIVFSKYEVNLGLIYGLFRHDSLSCKYLKKKSQLHIQL